MTIALPLLIAVVGGASMFLIAISMIPSTNVLKARMRKL